MTWSSKCLGAATAPLTLAMGSKSVLPRLIVMIARNATGFISLRKQASSPGGISLTTRVHGNSPPRWRPTLAATAPTRSAHHLALLLRISFSDIARACPRSSDQARLQRRPPIQVLHTEQLLLMDRGRQESHLRNRRRELPSIQRSGIGSRDVMLWHAR